MNYFIIYSFQIIFFRASDYVIAPSNYVSFLQQNHYSVFGGVSSNSNFSYSLDIQVPQESKHRKRENATNARTIFTHSRSSRVWVLVVCTRYGAFAWNITLGTISSALSSTHSHLRFATLWQRYACACILCDILTRAHSFALHKKFDEFALIAFWIGII